MELLPIVRVTSLTAAGRLVLSLGNLQNTLRISVSNCAGLIAEYSQPPVHCFAADSGAHIGRWCVRVWYRFVVNVMLM